MSISSVHSNYEVREFVEGHIGDSGEEQTCRYEQELVKVSVYSCYKAMADEDRVADEPLVL